MTGRGWLCCLVVAPHTLHLWIADQVRNDGPPPCGCSSARGEVTSVDYPVVLDVAGAGVRGVFWVVVPFLGDVG